MRGKGITSGRRPVRPDGTYYRETRRRRVSGGAGGRRMRAGWAAAITFLAITVVLVLTRVLR